jgi:hypothetical protein
VWLGACAGALALLNCNSLYFCCSRIRLGLALLEIYLDFIGFVVVELNIPFTYLDLHYLHS